MSRGRKQKGPCRAYVVWGDCAVTLYGPRGKEIGAITPRFWYWKIDALRVVVRVPDGAAVWEEWP